MLSSEDQRRLAAIERWILAEDPAFARRLAGLQAGSRSTWSMVASAFIAIACMLATLMGVLADSGVLVLEGALLTAAAGWAFWSAKRRGWRLSGRSDRPPEG
jgi:Protein of unknown function (DUF3040)